MKQQLCTMALSSLLALGMTAAAAQAQDAPPPQGDTQQQGSMQGPGGRHGMDPEEQLARMAKHYKLSADQQAQIKPILMAQHDQMEQMHADTSMSRQEKMEKMRTSREESKAKIEAVLTPEQKQKFEADQARMQQHHMDHMQNGSGGMAPGGDQGAPPPAPPQ